MFGWVVSVTSFVDLVLSSEGVLFKVHVLWPVKRQKHLKQLDEYVMHIDGMNDIKQ